jgi:hypothetical protein
VHNEQLLRRKSMSGYGTQMKMDKATKPCYNVCGACGTEIARTEVLCKECILAYDAAAIKVHGEFAQLNFK